MTFAKRCSTALVGLCTILATTANAQEIRFGERSEFYGSARGWDVYAITTNNGFDSCRGIVTGPDGDVMLELYFGEWAMIVPTTLRERTGSGIFSVDSADFEVTFEIDRGYAIYNLPRNQLERIRKGSNLGFEIYGDGLHWWSLTGSAATILKVKECSERSGAVTAAPAPVPQAPVRPAPKPAGVDHSCPAPGDSWSVQGVTPAEVEFINSTNKRVFVYWLDGGGTPIEYFELAPGQSQFQTTYAEHRWMVQDIDGWCYGHTIQPAPGNSFYEIR